MCLHVFILLCVFFLFFLSDLWFIVMFSLLHVRLLRALIKINQSNNLCNRCVKWVRPCYLDSTYLSARTSETDRRRWRTTNHVVSTVTSLVSIRRESRYHVIHSGGRLPWSTLTPRRLHSQGLWCLRGVTFPVSRSFVVLLSSSIFVNLSRCCLHSPTSLAKALCFRAVRPSRPLVRPSVRTYFVTTISHERLELSRWNLQETFTGPRWWHD